MLECKLTGGGCTKYAGVQKTKIDEKLPGAQHIAKNYSNMKNGRFSELHFSKIDKRSVQITLRGHGFPKRNETFI